MPKAKKTVPPVKKKGSAPKKGKKAKRIKVIVVHRHYHYRVQPVLMFPGGIDLDDW